MIAPIDLGWLAGVVEGEGTFIWNNGKYPCVAVRMTDEDTIRKLHRVAGVGNVTGPYDRDAWTPIWRWAVTKQADAAGLMMTLYPLMGLRRQARIREILLEWRST